MEYIFSNKVANLKPSAIREILKHASNPEIIPFAAGNPAVESFPVEEMAEIAADIFKNNYSAALQYGITEGYTPLRDLSAKRLKEKFNIGKDFDNTVIVSGGQQGIDLTCKVLCNEEDTVICETPSFIGALNAFRAYNVKLCGVTLEQDGMNIAELENALKNNKNVKFIYTIPTFQNPGGITTSFEKRKAIYELARKYNVFILEDNPYGELRYYGEDIPTIKSLDVDGRVIYVGSYSKILSAGIRLGFVCAPNEIIQKIVVAKQTNDVHTNQFFQILAAKFLTQYNLDEHVTKINNIYRRKLKLMTDGAKEHFPENVSYTKPEGGLFVWCTAPSGTDVVELANILIKKKLAIVPGIAFLADEKESCSSFRINFSTPSDEQIVEGMKILGETLKELSNK